MGAANAGPVASLAAAGLTAASTINQAKATQAADEMQAARAEKAAEFGKLNAGLTDATMRENLNTTLGNIEAIRAAGHVDPTSPTTAAILDRQTQISNRQRTSALVSINAQVADDQASATYLREAGRFALGQGKLGALAGFLGAGAQGASSGSFGLPGGGGGSGDALGKVAMG